MASNGVSWQPNEHLAVGKGATVQEFVATLGRHKFEIDVAPWGEGHLKVNGRQVAHVNCAKDRRQAFHDLKKIAEKLKSGLLDETSSSAEAAKKKPGNGG